MNAKLYPFILILMFSASSSWATTRYVTDQFEITMRSGQSTSNSITSMLKSGQPLKVLEENNETKYSFVETADGKQGYVLTRFLDDVPSGRDRLQSLTQTSEKQKASISELTDKLREQRQIKGKDDATIADLRQTLTRTQNELVSLQESTRDTVRVIKQNENLQSRINELDADIRLLSTENAEYKDQTAMDWFVRGASVSLIAFLLGILVTRVRWKKRDSWGSY